MWVRSFGVCMHRERERNIILEEPIIFYTNEIMFFVFSVISLCCDCVTYSARDAIGQNE